MRRQGYDLDFTGGMNVREVGSDVKRLYEQAGSISVGNRVRLVRTGLQTSDLKNSVIPSSRYWRDRQGT